MVLTINSKALLYRSLTMQIKIQLFLVLFLSLSSISLAKPSESYEYEKLFQLSRELLTRPEVREFLKITFKEELKIGTKIQEFVETDEAKIKDVSENQLVLLLQQNPDLYDSIEQFLREVPATADLKSENMVKLRKQWRSKIREEITPDRLENFRKINNPTNPLLLKTKDGEPAFKNVKLYVNHLHYDANGNKREADDLKQVWIDFLSQAKKEIVLNVFDFDLMDIAEVLVQQRKNGVKVSVGIDAGVIETRGEVKDVFDYLVKNKVNAVAVKSVGLNHQKIAAIDWSVPKQAKVLLSSGNLTQSCIGKEGDLVGFQPRPEASIPNANHVLTLESEILAHLVNHELTKTLAMKLRGREYPLTGAYSLHGEVDLETRKPKVLIISFTPGGGLRDVNSYMIARSLAETKGDVYMAQFAFSSDPVYRAIIKRAKDSGPKKSRFLFIVGDTPFAMQDWSIPLKLSGYKLLRDGEKKEYLALPDNRLEQVMGKSAYQAFVKQIRIAPPKYGNSHVELAGKKHPVSAKIHHKLIASDTLSNLGTSFNFSAGAESNNEQIVFWIDSELAKQAKGIVKALYELSPRSVVEEAIRRNRFRQFDNSVGENVDEPEQRKVTGN